ncbi:hypothetical protein EJ04DRAFT_66864 [Polyplosphaeria fusca]|uniref:Uncharacterized protein n=1 Tax=Polyplosphaeria fusca TaxID=682080 RepID=A0A9P4UY08_9PLEO|nr:hypothetical protein EJ04DRAFT_66864 [Polyplosphaeria fusca]
MENNDRRQRQSNSGYTSQQGTILAQSQYPVVSGSDRFSRQPPTSAPQSSASRSSSQGFGYGYGEGSQFVGGAIQPASVGYGGQEFSAEQQQPPQQPQPQRASQQYGQYGQNVMYNESVQQYNQPRDSSAMEVLSTGFPVAQPQYYVPGQGGPTSAPSGLAAGSQNVPSAYSSLGYTTDAPVGRETIAPAFSAAGMTDPHQAPAPGGYAQQSFGQPSGNEYDEFYNNYQSELKKTFEYVRDGRLSEAAASLSRLSDWLLHWAETLGLVRDDEAHHAQRLTLWQEFNDCWLTTLQRQTETMQDVISSGQRPQPPQSLIEADFLEKMGTQLIKNCDNIEKHGLVDYQMGVWEEEILAMLTTCLDQWEAAGVAPSSQRSLPSASSSRRR